MIMLAVSAAAAFVAAFVALGHRVVVSTNDMHIIQRKKTTTSYGKDQPAGNVYYSWPAFLPFIGVRVTMLPVNVFAQNLNDYAAYDKGRVPFIIDVVGFFRIVDSNVAAQRVADMKQLVGQLEYILKGSIRSILANSEIEEILEGRSKFGEMFTKEVDEQLKEWGVHSVKTLELMDIRDAQGSQVIANIMAKKKSLIEMQSRVAVAGNMQAAKVAEIEAARVVSVQEQDAAEQVGVRTAEKAERVGIREQQASQAVNAEAAVTAKSQMEVTQVNQVRAAEIVRAAKVIEYDQERQRVTIEAEATRQRTVTVADGDLEAAKRRAQATEVEGRAKGEAETAVLMAPVRSQIALAEKIGSDKGYQQYLVTIRQIEAGQAVGVEQAKALEKAQVKVIANTGGSVKLDGAMDLFTPKGGTVLAAAVEAFRQADAGKDVVDAVTKRLNGEDAR